MRRLAVTALACLSFTTAALAQTAPAAPVGPDFSKIAVTTTDLGHRTYMLEGAGAT